MEKLFNHGMVGHTRKRIFQSFLIALQFIFPFNYGTTIQTIMLTKSLFSVVPFTQRNKMYAYCLRGNEMLTLLKLKLKYSKF